MDGEKSSNSSFEDLSNINEQDANKVSTMFKQHSTSKDKLNTTGSSRIPVSNTNFSTELPERSQSGISSLSRTGFRKYSFQDDSEMPELEQIEPDKKVKPSTAETATTTMTSSWASEIGGSGSGGGGGCDLSWRNSSRSPSIGEDEACDILGNGQLLKKILTRAPKENRRPLRGELVTLSYKGMLDNGNVVEKMDELKIHVGDFEVVQAIDMILPLMNIGETAEVMADARFCYSSLGLKNEEKPELTIPPDANLVYHVHLIDAVFEDFADLKSYAIRKKYGTAKKERANFWYNRNEYGIAIQLYRRALEYLDYRDGDPDSQIGNEDLELTNGESQSLLDDRLVVYNNLAMAQIKMSAFDAALKSVENVLECQPNNSKALYRKGRILDGKGDTKGAILLLQKAATFEPENRTIQQDLARLIIKARREEHNEKEMYQKMLGQAKKLELKNKQTQKQQSVDNSKLKILGYLMGSILIGVAGVALYRYKY